MNDSAQSRTEAPATRMHRRLFAPQYWPTWIGLAVLRCLEPLPYSLLMMLGAGLGNLIRILPVGFVRIARANLALCFPEQTAAHREQILRQHFQSLGKGLMETAMSWWSSDARILKLTQVDGAEHLQQALAQGQGALFLSAHFTTVEMSGRALTIRYPMINIMYRPTKNAVMSFFLARNRAHHVKRAIRRDDIRTLVSALKANEVVWYAPDQAYRKKGAQMVMFFGTPAATNTATSRLAKMTSAAVLPYFSERLPNGAGYRMTICAAFENFPSDHPAADAERYHRAIETQIRRAPDQYLWIHRRFKGLSEDYPDYYSNKSSS